VAPNWAAAGAAGMTRVPPPAAGLTPHLLSLFRVVAALLFLEHGTAKLFGFPHLAMFDGLPLLSLYGIAGIIETVGSVLLLLGLSTRPIAFLLSGEMAIAYFHDHAPAGFFPILNDGEETVFYCFAFLYLAAAGGGRWSLDAMRQRIRSTDRLA
jgi:putative oxidoreductase